MTSLFLVNRLGNRPDVPLLKLLRGEAGTMLHEPPQPFSFSLLCTDSPTEADVHLLPQAVYDYSAETQRYINQARAEARQVRKPLVVFVGGDWSHDLFFPDDVVVLKATQYRHLQRRNEIIIPPVVEDFGAHEPVSPRPKGARPVVGFCGWADFPDVWTRVKYWARLTQVDLEKLWTLDSGREVFKKGLYFRRRALASLKASSCIDTNFIIRSSFSANPSTVSLPLEQARREYVENLFSSDLILAPKGDANYSVRFFEALSVGRIPILIDTECCLPLQDRIDYDSFILRVSYRDIGRLPDIVADFWSSLTPQQYQERQRRAREAFTKYLRYDSFFNMVFADIAAGGIIV